MNDGREIGVVVGRFQSPQLHHGHRRLLDHVAQRHQSMLVVVGCCEPRLSLRNPLDYETRRLMVSNAYPRAHVAALLDRRDDSEWSYCLDQIVAGAAGPGVGARLYGSRDSFLETYSGQYPVVRIATAGDWPSATVLRAQIQEPRGSVDFRAGVIYASRMRWATSYQTVDVAVYRDWQPSRQPSVDFLLGRKDRDGGPLRFPGGFVQPPDESLEAAAARELREETGLSAEDVREMEYVGSVKIDDWRYRPEDKDSIVTAFFVADQRSGTPTPGDDLDGVEWVRSDELEGRVVPEHLPLAEMAMKWLRSTAKED